MLYSALLALEISVTNNPNNSYDIMDLVQLNQYSENVNCVCRPLSSKKQEEHMCGGHVTGSFAGGSRKGLQRGRQTQFMFSDLTDLVKQNPLCHMNYSIIFTEINFFRNFMFPYKNSNQSFQSNLLIHIHLACSVIVLGFISAALVPY